MKKSVICFLPLLRRRCVAGFFCFSGHCFPLVLPLWLFPDILYPYYRILCTQFFPYCHFSPSFLILLPAHPFTLIFYCSRVSHLLSPPPPHFNLFLLTRFNNPSRRLAFSLPCFKSPFSFHFFLPFSTICTFSSSHFPIFFHPSLTCLFPILSLALLCPA